MDLQNCLKHVLGVYETECRYLKKINVKSDDLCRFCTSNVETITHIFISCTKTHTLWSELSLHIYRKCSERIGFNVSNIIFGEIIYFSAIVCRH